MTADKLTSPCPSCARWREDKSDCAEYCQSRVDFLHTVFNEPWHNCAALRREHDTLFIPSRQLDFSGPGPKARKFDCPICNAEVETSLHQQRTCGEPDCQKKYARLADAARKAKNRERNNARERQRKREKRMAGGVI